MTWGRGFRLGGRNDGGGRGCAGVWGYVYKMFTGAWTPTSRVKVVKVWSGTGACGGPCVFPRVGSRARVCVDKKGRVAVFRVAASIGQPSRSSFLLSIGFSNSAANLSKRFSRSIASCMVGCVSGRVGNGVHCRGARFPVTLNALEHPSVAAERPFCVTLSPLPSLQYVQHPSCHRESPLPVTSPLPFGGTLSEVCWVGPVGRRCRTQGPGGSSPEWTENVRGLFRLSE